MKKILIFAVFLSVHAFCFSQPYHNFPDSNAIWNSVGHNIFTSAKYEFRFGLSGDTVIGSKTYSKVYSMIDTNLSNPQAPYFGAIREDENKRVHFLRPGYEETILYDFSAAVGDTIWYQIGGGMCGDTFSFWPQTIHFLAVTSIDSLLLENGEYRKRWNLMGEMIADQWVEGIGSITWLGLFTPLLSAISLCGDGYSFACFRQDYQTLFLYNENCETCYCDILLSSQDIFNNNDNRLSIFPNPATSEIVVSFMNASEQSLIEIISMTGQTIRSFSRMHQEYIKISTAAMQPGQYLLVIKDEANRVIRKGKFFIR